MITYHRITTSDPLYPGEASLRERVLLRPIGYDMPRFVAEYPYEDRFEHFVAAIDLPPARPRDPGETWSGFSATDPERRVVGCAVLLADYPEAGTGKLMQMAVDPQRQREGIGRRLVIEIERRAFGELGLSTLFCHAREDAVPYYERLGWAIVGERFDEAGIPHYKMTISAG